MLAATPIDLAVRAPRFDDLVAYERGELTFDETVALFQGLVDSGAIRDLQPWYLRTALALADQGHLILDADRETA
jgi:hypothetical protein